MNRQRKTFYNGCNFVGCSKGYEKSTKSLRSTILIWLLIIAIGLSALGCNSGNHSSITIISGCSSLYMRPSYIPQDAGRFYSNGHYYKVFHERLTWKEACDRCILMNGYLACITTKAENDFILALAREQTYPQYTCCWIGSTDEKKESQWDWITGESLGMKENLFATGGKYENYLNLRLSTGNWEDYSMVGEQVGEQWFVCEWD